ncbi:MAG: hypothetical protein MJE63_05450 [Proteobacteria bacterium]|nr:hypothetical protein [Pseudomonadota bacterium]
MSKVKLVEAAGVEPEATRVYKGFPKWVANIRETICRKSQWANTLKSIA